MKDITNLMGIGPTVIENLKAQGIKTTEDIISAPDDARIPKSIRLSAEMSNFETRVTRERADLESRKLPKIKGIEKFIVGSYRRGSTDMKDLDILLVSDLDDPITKFVSRLDDHWIISSQGPTKAFLWVLRNRQAIRVDLVAAKVRSKYAALVHYTGSARSNIKLRTKAKSMGMLLNEKYLRLPDGEIYYPKCECDVFTQLGIECVEPEDRV